MWVLLHPAAILSHHRLFSSCLPRTGPLLSYTPATQTNIHTHISCADVWLTLLRLDETPDLEKHLHLRTTQFSKAQYSEPLMVQKIVPLYWKHISLKYKSDFSAGLLFIGQQIIRTSCSHCKIRSQEHKKVAGFAAYKQIQTVSIVLTFKAVVLIQSQKQSNFDLFVFSCKKKKKKIS